MGLTNCGHENEVREEGRRRENEGRVGKEGREERRGRKRDYKKVIQNVVRNTYYL